MLSGGGDRTIPNPTGILEPSLQPSPRNLLGERRCCGPPEQAGRQSDADAHANDRQTQLMNGSSRGTAPPHVIWWPRSLGKPQDLIRTMI